MKEIPQARTARITTARRSAARGTNERDDPRLAGLPRNRLALHILAAYGTPRLGHRIEFDTAAALHKKTSAGDPRIHTGGTWGNARNDRQRSAIYAILRS